jgi:hypothetical protein
MNYVRDNLAICGFHEIGSREQFRSYGFNAQLQCTGPFDPWLGEELEVLAIPFDDGMAIPASVFRDAQRWLDRHWDSRHRILISCAAGRSRSVTMTIALLHRRTGQPFGEAAREVLAKRPEAYPHPDILLSAARYCGERLTFARLRRLYDEAPVQPPYPWPDELLHEALGRSLALEV